MPIICDNEFAQVEYKADIQSVQVIWREYEVHAHRQVFDEIMKTIQHNPTYTYITDLRKYGNQSPINPRWIARELLPVATFSGLQKVAIIPHENMQVKGRSKEPEEDTQLLDFRYFSTIDAARRWASEVQKQYDTQAPSWA